ncbi:LPXTG cell wall anchor domain-containing protein [Streptococcus sp. O1]|uniref:SspB-related isopeptide-forming adhesin n=1 Tax=Streptococcus sp. O1 TaxID=2928735 RepID=UPI00211B4870|nr:SspB-related isopeptide-forming adhesin [Streptococcus sp. O1]MCQ9214499.1 LPXTG cell wall anchor domain-containing protein [Streptococcus sp. O1]
MTLKNQGKGYFRKSKAYGLVCGIALGLALIFNAGQVSADEVTAIDDTSGTAVVIDYTQDNTSNTQTQVADDMQPTSTNDNDTYAKQANTSSVAQDVPVDNTVVTRAAEEARQVGAEVTQDQTQDKGTPTTTAELNKAQSEIAQDQTQQVNKLNQAKQEATDRKEAYDQAESAYQDLNKQVSEAVAQGGGMVSSETITQSSGDGTDVSAYQDYTTKVRQQIEADRQAIQAFQEALGAVRRNTNVTVNASVAVQDVDNLTYGNSIMTGGINADGSFSFTHDMNDGDNDVAGILGTGTLTGRLNYSTTANGDGTITVHLNNVELYSYTYVANRANHAVDQRINFHVFSLGGNEVYNSYHSGGTSFTDTINRSVTLGNDYVLTPGQSSGNIGFLNIDDNWIYNTHGQAYVHFTNPNVMPTAVVKNINAPVVPIMPKVSYHGYELKYQPVVTKTQTNSDNVTTDGLTVVKGDMQRHELNYQNVLANVKTGETILISDPLDRGVGSDSERILKEAMDKGWTANFEEVSNTYTFSYVYQGQLLDAPVLYVQPEYDTGSSKNTYKVQVGDYSVYSNTVSYKTPDKPTPIKTVTDVSGADIDGATIFDKRVNYGLTTDYSSYANLTASKEAIAKGFGLLDDVQDGAFTVDLVNISIKDSQNKDVSALFDMYHVLSDKGRTEVVENFLKQAGLTPKGEFYLWLAKDPVTYYSDYVLKNNNITITLPVTLLVGDGEKVENDFQQIDFGNSYTSNLVVNHIPTVKPEKHALSAKDENNVLDGQEVKIGDYIRYLLDGVMVGKHHDTLWQYDGLDRLDTTHDRYTGNWKAVVTGTEYTAKADMVLAYDVTLEDGTLIKAGDTVKAGSKYSFTFEFNQNTNSDFINKIVTVVWNEEKGEWSYRFDKDFLNSLGVEGTFDADFYIEVERISAGEVENTFVNIVNGKEMIAKVTTVTPEPLVPLEPEPPVQKVAILPQTGEASGVLTLFGSFLLSGLGLVGVRKRKENQ